MASSSPLFFPEDEQYARDLQYALDIQEKEERKARKRKEKGAKKNEAQPASALGDGYFGGSLNADHMLFVACTIDQREVAMLVDTGASTSAMSIEMVHLLGLERKLNSTIYGNAKGVGSSSILGIVEHVNCMIGEDVGFRSFFMVLDGKMPFCILGLDQMRRFNCIIDVGGNSLIFGGKDGVSVPFLPKDAASTVAYCMMYDANNESSTAQAPAAAAPSRSLPQPSQPQPSPEQRENGSGWGSYFSRKKKGGR